MVLCRELYLFPVNKTEMMMVLWNVFHVMDDRRARFSMGSFFLWFCEKHMYRKNIEIIDIEFLGYLTRYLGHFANEKNRKWNNMLHIKSSC